jgi:hypothetical protein
MSLVRGIERVLRNLADLLDAAEVHVCWRHSAETAVVMLVVVSIKEGRATATGIFEGSKFCLAGMGRRGWRCARMARPVP